MSTYKIIGKTNGWIARRDTMFNGKCEVILEQGLSLKDAKTKLLNMLNDDYDKGYNNWGLAIAHRVGDCFHYSDDTYRYEYDGRYFSIEEEDGE